MKSKSVEEILGDAIHWWYALDVHKNHLLVKKYEREYPSDNDILFMYLVSRNEELEKCVIDLVQLVENVKFSHERYVGKMPIGSETILSNAKKLLENEQ